MAGFQLTLYGRIWVTPKDGALYQTAMLHIYQHIDRAIERWARRKYKALSGRKRGSVQWLRKMKGAEPRLFHHWRVVGDRVG